MSNTREILTLQFGHFSNFVGTHFWNTQELSFNYHTSETEINHDVLFREGQTSKGQTTYTPRLLIADLKGSLKSLSKESSLYNKTEVIADEINTWPVEQIEVQHEEEVERSTYQQILEENAAPPQDLNIDKDVNVWGDFLYSRFHPRTINIINEYQHEDTKQPFNTFPVGNSLWKTDSFQEDFVDKIRLYSEECDNIQGFLMLFDATKGFAGLASSCVETLRDDFENKSIFMIPLFSSIEKEGREKLIEQINIALALSKIYEQSSLIVPMSLNEKGWRDSNLRKFKYIEYNNLYNYHTSAILASAIDTFTLRYRNKRNASYLFHLCNDLNGGGRKIVASSISLPFTIAESEDLIDCLNTWDGPLYESLTPRCNITSDRCMQSVTIRGVPESRLKHPPTENNPQREYPAYRCNSVHEMLSFYMSCTSYASPTHLTCINRPLGVQVPFPNFFNEHITKDGLLSKNCRHENERVDSVPVIAGLHAYAGVGDMLESLYRETERLKLNKFNEYSIAGLENDDYKAALYDLADIREKYIDEHLL